jgi:hypothetical protein
LSIALELDEVNLLKQNLLKYEKQEFWENPNCAVLINNDTLDIVFIGLAYNATGFIPKEQLIPNAVDIHSKRIDDDKLKPFAPENLPLGALMDRYTHQEVRLAEIFLMPADKKYLLIPLETLFFRPEHLDWFKDYMKNNEIELVGGFFTQLREQVTQLKDTPKKPLEIIKSSFQLVNDNKESQIQFNHCLENMFNDRMNLILKVFPIKDDEVPISKNRYLLPNQQKATNNEL